MLERNLLLIFRQAVDVVLTFNEALHLQALQQEFAERRHHGVVDKHVGELLLRKHFAVEVIKHEMELQRVGAHFRWPVVARVVDNAFIYFLIFLIGDDHHDVGGVHHEAIGVDVLLLVPGHASIGRCQREHVCQVFRGPDLVADLDAMVTCPSRASTKSGASLIEAVLSVMASSSAQALKPRQSVKAVKTAVPHFFIILFIFERVVLVVEVDE